MIEDPQDTKECRNRALNLLSRRTHFSAELRRKLLSRGFDPRTVEHTLEGLAQEQLINDREASREFVETKLRRKAVGRMRLLSELSRRGVDRDLAEQVVDSVYPSNEEELARRAAATGASDDHRALGRRLQRLGFRPSTIRKVLGER